MRKLRNNCKKLLGLSLVALAWAAHAKTAPEYYQTGATNYVHGKWLAAKAAVTNGLALYPTDEKLQALNKLLDSQQQQQQQQQDQQKDQKEDQSKQQEQKSQEDQQQQQQQEQQQKEQAQNQPKQDQQKPSDKREQSPEQKPAGEGKKEDEQKDGKEGQATAQQFMTPEQAQRLLEAIKSDEKIMIFTPQTRTNRNNNRVLKDW